MKIIFIIPFWYEEDGRKIASSPFIIPQINDLIPFLSSHEIIYLQTGFNLSTLWMNYKKLQKILINNSSEVIIYSMYGSLHGFMVEVFLGNKFKIINSFGGSDILGSTNSGLFWKIKDLITKKISLFTAKKVNHVIVKSDSLKQYLINKVSTPISIVPNGVDFNLFYPLECKSKLRKELCYSEIEFIVLFNLRRKNAKGESVKNFKLANKVIEKLKELIDIPVRFELISNKSHDEINKLFCIADCLLLTSLHEGSPNIIKEAMSCNLPIVSVNCGDVNERLRFTENSYVSKLYDEIELAYYCQKIYINKNRSNGREELIKQKIDSNNIAKKIIDIFQSLNNE